MNEKSNSIKNILIIGGMIALQFFIVSVYLSLFSSFPFFAIIIGASSGILHAYLSNFLEISQKFKFLICFLLLGVAIFCFLPFYHMHALLLEIQKTFPSLDTSLPSKGIFSIVNFINIILILYSFSFIIAFSFYLLRKQIFKKKGLK